LSLAFLTTNCRTPGSKAGASGILTSGGNSQGLAFYEATRILNLKPEKSCRDFKAQVGITVTRRDGQAQAKAGRIRVLSDNPNNEIYIIYAGNEWGEKKTDADRLLPVANSPFFEGSIQDLKHGMEYRLLVNNKQLLDPAALLYTTPSYYKKIGDPRSTPFLNSVFWDFDRPEAYKMTTTSVDLRTEPLIIAESEVMELVRKWPRPGGGGQGPARLQDTYSFVASSGVIDELKRSGYNAVEFLPFNTSMDGEHWHYRYQVYGLFAPDSRYGDPDDFEKMMDAFNKAGIGVIMDAVVGHYPFKGNNGIRSLEPIGLHNWKKSDGKSLYGNVASPWGTNRYDYANPFVRRFLTDSIMTMMCRYGISGIRFDNLDGIRLYDGPGGGGPEFLKELVDDLRAYRPESILIAEMFFGYSPVMQRRDEGGYGINFRTHSDFFDFIKDNMLKNTEAVDMGRLRAALRNPWDWQEAARVQYITNHDEAANGRDGATGSYPAALIKGPNNTGWQYVEKKTIAFGSLAMLSGSAYLDMPQMRLLQQGSFNDDSAVDWSLLQLDSQKAVYQYFAALSNFIKSEPAFAFSNFHPNIENHIDTEFDQRIISLARFDKKTEKAVYAVINLGHKEASNYPIGINQSGVFRLVISSDSTAYNGSGRLEKKLPSGVLNAGITPFQGKTNSLTIPYVAPYSISVWESK
jgi:1,4-alpha-glucan branching enzyme